MVSPSRGYSSKDNLLKRNWYESKACVFCSQDETIKHLFFQCNFARSIWSAIQEASCLYPPTSVTNILRNWLDGIGHKYKIILRWSDCINLFALAMYK
jgi:hypothetical protein